MQGIVMLRMMPMETPRRRRRRRRRCRRFYAGG